MLRLSVVTAAAYVLTVLAAAEERRQDPTFGGALSYIYCASRYSSVCMNSGCTALNRFDSSRVTINLREASGCLSDCRKKFPISFTYIGEEKGGVRRLLIESMLGNTVGPPQLTISIVVQAKGETAYAMRIYAPSDQTRGLQEFGRCSMQSLSEAASAAQSNASVK